MIGLIFSFAKVVIYSCIHKNQACFKMIFVEFCQNETIFWNTKTIIWGENCVLHLHICIFFCTFARFLQSKRKMSKILYIIAGCNGAGKTTASFTILPEIWHCQEFVNADEIARGLSPLNPNSMAIPAGRIMLQRIDELLQQGVSF